MWKIFQRSLIVQHITQQSKRTFLSDAYKCTEAWNSRLATPILQKVSLESFYYELDQKFQQQGKVSAIDIDIFANRITDEHYHEELADLVHKLRMTEETTNSLESMGHALIRLYLNCNNTKELLDILNDRLSYGIFLDSYIANIAIDQFIKVKDFKSAARISSFMMLQEQFDNPITIGLSLYACMKFLEAPESFETKPEPIVVAAPDEKISVPVKAADKKKTEEIKVRVGFIRNEYFDDHFDLNDSQLLVGKTLVMIGDALIVDANHSSLGKSAKLLGLCLYRKYDKALQYVETVKGEIYKDAAKIAESMLSQQEAATDDDVYKKLIESVQKLSLGKCIEDNFEKSVWKFTNDTIAQFEKKDIENQIKVIATNFAMQSINND